MKNRNFIITPAYTHVIRYYSDFYTRFYQIEPNITTDF